MSIKTAIVGCGRIFKRHCEALRYNDNFEIIAVCDILPERLRIASETLGIPGYYNIDELIKKIEKIDLIVICTQPSEHAKIAIRAIKNNINVLIEKPITLSIDDCYLIYNSLKENKFKSKIYEVKQNRYNAPIEELKKIMFGGFLGKIVLISARLRWCRFDDYFNQDPINWRGTWKHDGGVFASQACHHIDMLRYIGGKILDVTAKAKKTLLNIETEDTGIAICEYADGFLGTIEATNAARPDNLEASISVLGENGTVIIGGTHLNKIDYWKVKDITSPMLSDDNTNIYGIGHKRVYEEVYKDMSGEKSNVVDLSDAMENVRLVNAIYESIYTGTDEIARSLQAQPILSYLLLYSPAIMALIGFVGGAIMFSGGQPNE